MDPIAWPAPPSSHEQLGRWIEDTCASANRRRSVARRSATMWAWCRLFTFSMIPGGAYLYFAAALPWGAAIAVLGVLFFAAAVRFHERATRAKLCAENVLLVLEESRRRITGEPIILRSGVEPGDLALWASLYGQSGSDASPDRLSPQEIDDLDLFGERLSLFGLLNRASTPAGAARLSLGLTSAPMDSAAIQLTQAAVQALATDHADRTQLLASAAPMRSMATQFDKFYDTMRKATPLEYAGTARVIRYWGLAGPTALMVSLADALGLINSAVGWFPLVAILIINAIAIPSFLRGVKERLRPWLELEPIVGAMRRYAEDARAILPDSVRLRELRAAFDESLAPGGLASLHRRIPFVYLGLAGVLHTIIDVVCLWDLQVLLLIERCSLRERRRILQAVSAVGELEMISSLAAFSAEQPDANWPKIVDGPPRLTIREGRHPLVGHERAVANTATLGEGENTWLITGSNMSGKSTFLRMLGSNVLLARAGSAVCAEEMTLTPLRILTDLRIRDDLARQESYFLAEVRQVRRMVEDARAGTPILALIDEPFRGTNSAERVAAAGAVIGSLIRGSGLHLIATHDAALATIAAREGGANYHFEERFEQSQMVFDYRIRPGPARGRNALRVLESENYPGDVIARARELAAELGDKPPPSDG
ncbi:hypothetical protein B7486_26115 [cyanobacterium TDX16]|nr:hypothetical protein B7486_26115 [cyanobacterium TDX16]